MIAIFGIFFLLPFKMMATEKVNIISCTFFKTQSGWERGPSAAFADSFDLAREEIQFVGGFYTNTADSDGKTVGNGICTLLRGMADSNLVLVENHIYQGERIGNFVEQDCFAIGDDVKKLRVDQRVLRRGQWLQSDLAWEPPIAESFRLKIYFPKLSEIPQLGELLESKCEKETNENALLVQ